MLKRSRCDQYQVWISWIRGDSQCYLSRIDVLDYRLGNRCRMDLLVHLRTLVNDVYVYIFWIFDVFWIFRLMFDNPRCTRAVKFKCRDSYLSYLRHRLRSSRHKIQPCFLKWIGHILHFAFWCMLKYVLVVAVGIGVCNRGCKRWGCNPQFAWFKRCDSYGIRYTQDCSLTIYVFW